MRTFTDKTGQPWAIDLTVGHLLNIKTELNLNLMDQPETVPDSVEKQVGILWITCFDDAKKLGLGPVDFAKRLGGRTLVDAWDAWMAEYIDFFVHLSPAQGQMLKSLWDKAKMLETARAKLIEQACLSTSSDWLESLDSIPDPTKDGCSSS
jgi:hypothetical protein